jgi:hypothetical protein
MTGCERLDFLQKAGGEGCRVESGTDQESGAGRGGEWNGHGQLGVVLAPDARIRLGPGEIKHEFAVRMAFDIRRRSGGQARLIGEGDIGRVPTGTGANALGVLESGQELVSQEGVSISSQGIPLPWVELVDAVMNARSGLCRAQECFSTSRASR